MIRTSFIIDKVPHSWIFEYYCKLSEKLHGQSVKIKSLFTFPEERSPSMVLYLEDGKYMFKDFSSGKMGDAIQLVKDLYDLPYSEAVKKISNDYINADKPEEEKIIIEEPKYKVISYETRKWNQNDVKFWTSFNIGSTLLNKYNVKPLSKFVIDKTGLKSFDIHGQYIYGYFKTNGELYKIYQPYKKDFKFFNVTPYIQGSEQLLYNKPTLIISSSLKDILALDSLNLELESVSANSENSILSRSVLSSYFLKYDKIATFFDNDMAGHNAMVKYEKLYGIPGIYLNLSKDLSDSVRDFGAVKTKEYLKPLIEII